jgi:hypothetical protein
MGNRISFPKARFIFAAVCSNSYSYNTSLYSYNTSLYISMLSAKQSKQAPAAV